MANNIQSKIKTVGYLRVSTEGQTGEDKFGLAEQKESIERYAKSNGFELVEWYSDPGVSGSTISRPGLDQMIKDSESKRFQAVIVAKMDRIARDLMFQLFIEKDLLKSDVELISVSEPFRGQDPSSVLFRQIIGAFAQFEKARISERLSGGRKQKAKTGGYAGGKAPIGYVSQRGNKVLTVDNKKADTVRRVLELSRKRSLSLDDIAEVLNSEGHTTAQGKPFHRMQVKRIIDRKAFYEGKYIYAGIEANGQHLAIV